MQYLVIAKLMILLTLANGSPVVAKRILRNNLSRPLDGNTKFFDGQPVFGSSKTVRGVVVSIVVTTACAPFLGLELKAGLLVGTAAMLGDLCSSFLKRRLGLAPSSRAIGLDQIPESFLPLLACWRALSLTVVDILVGTAIFFVGELLLSRVLFRLRIRDRPY